MDFELEEDLEILRKTAAQFVDQRVKPQARALDEAGVFPFELFRELGRMGWFGTRYPVEVGGTGAGTLGFVLLMEELARGSLSLAAAAAMQSLMGTNFVHALGTEDQRTRLLVPALQGLKLGTIAMTEPDFGSDLGGIRTTAVKEGDGWRLKGRKSWITSATVADFFTVAAKTSPDAGFKGIDLFLVEKGAPGLVVGRRIDKMGVRASETSELAFEDVRLGPDGLLGTAGTGWRHLGTVLNEIRVMTGALGLGLARAALDTALAYSRERVQFGKPIGEFQAVAHRLADTATELESARWLVYRAAWGVSRGKTDLALAAMAKLHATEVANRAADMATRVLGSYGLAMEYDAQRYFRDARFLLYGGGTSEILRTAIAKELSHGS